jgi:hypothetical protein
MLEGLREGDDCELAAFVVVAKADGSSNRLAVLVGEGVLVVLLGEGMAAARVMLSRRSWRTALRCLRWSLSRRVTLDAVRSRICTRGGVEVEREGLRMARRREAGTGPRLEERVDMVMEMRGRCGAHTIGQVCSRSQSLKIARFLVFGCLANVDSVDN